MICRCREVSARRRFWLRAPVVNRKTSGLDLGLLGHFQGVVHIDAKITDRRINFAVAEEQLNRAEILRAFVDQAGLGTAHGMRAVAGRIQPQVLHPATNHPGVLPRANMIVAIPPTREKIVRARHGLCDGENRVDSPRSTPAVRR